MSAVDASIHRPQQDEEEKKDRDIFPWWKGEEEPVERGRRSEVIKTQFSKSSDPGICWGSRM